MRMFIVVVLSVLTAAVPLTAQEPSQGLQMELRLARSRCPEPSITQLEDLARSIATRAATAVDPQRKQELERMAVGVGAAAAVSSLAPSPLHRAICTGLTAERFGLAARTLRAVESLKPPATDELLGRVIDASTAALSRRASACDCEELLAADYVLGVEIAAISNDLNLAFAQAMALVAEDVDRGMADGAAVRRRLPEFCGVFEQGARRYALIANREYERATRTE